MKHLLAFLAICITTWGCIPALAQADALQPGTLEFSLTQSTITLGEPLILKYRATNPEDQRVHVNIDNDLSRWLTVRLNDASGHPVRRTQMNDAVLQVVRRPITDGIPIGPNGQHEGFLVLSQNSEPTQAGHYQLSLSAHLSYAWGGRNVITGTSEAEQSYSLSLVVTARNPLRLRAVAESLRQTVLHDGSLDEYRLADKALFAMQDPVCLPVWRELATDAKLDPSKSIDVMGQLKDVGSASACDVLAEMQPIAPERWSESGVAPLDVLQSVWFTATPVVKQHINQLLAEAGIPAVTEHTKLTGTVN